jgi:hypothetical protein
VQSIPNPSGATFSELDDLSCTTASACIAVGTYGISPDTVVTLAEDWNGTSWTVQSTPNPSGATESDLAGVSCSWATACTAVGYYQDNSLTPETLAEVWNGTSWNVQTTPNPNGATDSYLFGVSCISATACTAVGQYDNSSDTDVTLAEVWNGTSWTVQSTPNPSLATDSELDAVSCSTATACTAVGDEQYISGTVETLAEAEGP